MNTLFEWQINLICETSRRKPKKQIFALKAVALTTRTPQAAVLSPSLPHNISLFHADLLFLSISQHRPSNGKDGWPTLSGYGGKLANGLSEDRKSPPLLDCCLDPEVMTSDGLGLGLGPDTGMGSVQGAALSPFSSNCDSNG